MSIKPYIRFPLSNNLNFKRLDDYDNYMESDSTRLYYDFAYTNLSNSCYFTKLTKDKGVWVQFRTSYTSIKAYIVDSNYNKIDVSSGLISGVSLTDDRKQYQLNVDLSSYEGYYHIRFEFEQSFFPAAYYQSEWFEVADNYDNCLLVEWKNGSFNPYNDGIVWGSSSQYMFIESRIAIIVPSVTKTIFTTENYKMISTQAHPLKNKKWEIELLPDYILELLNIAMQHDYFYINQVRYNSEDTIEVEQQGDTRLYSSNITLQIVEDAQGNGYEDYTNDIEITGGYPVFEDAYSLINDEDFSIINDDEYLNKLNN